MPSPYSAYEKLKIYERNPDTGVIRWRYMFEKLSEARILKDEERKTN